MIRSLLAAACLLLGASSQVHAQKLSLSEDELPFMDAARTAEAIADPMQRCLSYPDLPGNTWTPGLARKACIAFFTQPSSSLGDMERMLEARGGAKRLDALFRKELEANFNGEHDRIFRAFSSFGSCCVDRAERVARAWLKQSPDSPYAQTALGLALAERGWDARGDGSASETPAQNFQRMHAFFEAAIPQFDAALKTEPRMLPACNAMIRVGAQASRELQLRGTSLCLEAEPASFNVVWQMALATEPRWGGSPAQMRAVADYARSQMQSNPMLELLSVAPDLPALQDVNDADALIAAYVPVGMRVPNPAVLRWASSGYSLKPRDSTASMKALEWLSETLRFHPYDALTLRRRAFLMERFGDLEWAERDAARVLALEPGDLRMEMFLGSVLVQQWRHADALPHLQAAMADPKRHDVATAMRCRAMITLERLDDALECSEAMTRERPDSSEPWLIRLKALQRFDAPGAELAMRRLLATQSPDSVRFNGNMQMVREVREWMAAHHMEE